MKDRIRWIDGLKGLCCLGIFFHHYLLRYAPESYYGDIDSIIRNHRISYLSQSTLGILINGNFFVFIFVLLSGFVVSRRVYSSSSSDAGVFLISRYLKLSFPLLIVESLQFVFFKFKIGGEVLLETDEIRSIFQVLENALIRVPRFGDTTFAGAFWMMNTIHIGGGNSCCFYDSSMEKQKGGRISFFY